MGKVIDLDLKTPLANVSVLQKGTNNGTVTNDKGEYSISVPKGAVLIYSIVNYGSSEKTVKSNGNVDVSLISKMKDLNTVVVIAYGQKSRKLLTESIGSVGSKDIQKLPVASADAAIQGRVSGVQITNVDGSPGSPVSIRVRGVGTVDNAQPLFVIDGIPVGNGDSYNNNPLTTLNPSDIENISVLKDASSASLYGMRAANGVVLITTKRGKQGKPRVSLDAYYGIQQFPKKLAVNNTEQYVALAQEALNNRNTQDGLTPGQSGFRMLHPDLLPGTPTSVLGINTDWQTPTINKNAPVTSQNVSVSGGSENASYFFSIGHFAQEAITKNWDIDRYTLRANSDYKIGERFKIGQTLSLTFQERNTGMNGGGDGFLYANNISMPPFFKIYDEGKTIPGNRYGYNGNSGVAGFTIGNQLALNEIVKSKNQSYRLLGGVYAELEVINGLKYRSAASVDLGFGRDTRWQPGFTAAEIGYGREANNFSDGRSEGYTQVYTNTLTYDRKIGDHSVGALAGIEYQKIRGTGLSYTGNNFQSTSPAFYTVVSNGTAGSSGYQNAGSNAYNQAYASYFGRLSYNYKEKYLVTGTVRRDGTSRFAESNRWGTFPAVSAAWILSSEPFFQTVPVFSSLKLRGSWGKLGNANTSDFEYISRVSFTAQYPLNGIALQAPRSPSLPNSELGWETVVSKDFGIDASFLNNKLSLLATYYNRNTTNFLYFLPIPFTSGFSGTRVNVGDVKNTGFEFELGYRTSLFKKININLTGNFTTVKNTLVALAPKVQEYTSGGAYRTAIGYPIGYLYGYKQIGIYQNDAQAVAALPDDVAGATNKPRAGDAIFEDNNGPLSNDPDGKQFTGLPDGKITPEDRTYLGKTTPDFFYGFSIDANYKSFDVSILFQGVGGIQVYNQLRQNLENLGGPGRNQLATTQNRWKGEGTSNTMPRAVDGDPYQNNRISSRFVENAGFFRFKNLQIGYSFSPNILSHTRVFKSARIYAGATNLFRITRYTGLDPEVITFGSNSSQIGAGTDQGSTPQPRTFQAGFQLNF